VLYNTGARVSELIGIRVNDLEPDVTSSVRLHGKGRKQRTVPRWRHTAIVVRRRIDFAGLRTEQAQLPNRRRKLTTQSNVAKRITVAADAAAPGFRHC
jgi:integrase